jgi:pimeloyl-ACP methyl ester carboxylesterase
MVEHHYIHINGIKMHYVKAGQGERLVVLLHGFPEFWYSWRDQIPALSKQFTVVAPDLRGYNDTEKPLWGYGIDVLVNDVISLIRELGFQRAVVVGHDWGGAIAWATAIAYPHRVERLIVLNCPHPAIFRKALRTNRAQQRRSWYMGFFQLPFLPEAALRANNYAMIERIFRGSAIDKSRFRDEDIEQYKQALAKPGALTAALNYYRTAARSSARALGPGATGHVPMPTLLIWGEEDTALGKELTYDMEQYVPNLRIRYIPHCSHWVQQEQPELVNEYMQEFLAALA